MMLPPLNLAIKAFIYIYINALIAKFKGGNMATYYTFMIKLIKTFESFLLILL